MINAPQTDVPTWDEPTLDANDSTGIQWRRVGEGRLLDRVVQGKFQGKPRTESLIL